MIIIIPSPIGYENQKGLKKNRSRNILWFCHKSHVKLHRSGLLTLGMSRYSWATVAKGEPSNHWNVCLKKGTSQQKTTSPRIGFRGMCLGQQPQHVIKLARYRNGNKESYSQLLMESSVSAQQIIRHTSTTSILSPKPTYLIMCVLCSKLEDYQKSITIW